MSDTSTKLHQENDNNSDNKKVKYIDSKAYPIVDETLNALTHGIGFILAIIAFIALANKAQEPLELASYIIYGSSMALMFLGSTLYHSLKSTKASKVFHIIDHSGIYLLIAGTYTPFCFAIGGWLGLTVCIIEWTMAIIGILGKATLNKLILKYSTWIYIIMGWFAVLTIVPVYQAIGAGGTVWLGVGGILYTVGAVIYSVGKKKNLAHAHVVWHIFVVLAAAAMFISIYRYV